MQLVFSTTHRSDVGVFTTHRHCDCPVAVMRRQLTIRNEVEEPCKVRCSVAMVI